jgi:hypothetical protein
VLPASLTQLAQVVRSETETAQPHSHGRRRQELEEGELEQMDENEGIVRPDKIEKTAVQLLDTGTDIQRQQGGKSVLKPGCKTAPNSLDYANLSAVKHI